jgi:hypothetical protein
VTPADMTIQTLAADEAGLLAQNVELRADRDVWRELALASIRKNHDLTSDNDRLRDENRRLRDEYRALREQVLRDVRREAA